MLSGPTLDDVLMFDLQADNAEQDDDVEVKDIGYAERKTKDYA